MTSLKHRAKLLRRAMRRPPWPYLTTPSYAYCFIKGGHSRTFMLWVLLLNMQLHRLEVMRCGHVAAIASYHMSISAGHAYALLRQGNGFFWDFYPGEGFLELRRRSAIHELIRRNHLAPVVKKSIFAIPWKALANLEQLHAYMTFPVQSRSEEAPTARAYAARCTGLSVVTISHYRRILRQAHYIEMQRNYERQVKDVDRPLARGEFRHSANAKVALRRLADTIFLDRSKDFFTDKELPITNVIRKRGSSSKGTRSLDFSNFHFRSSQSIFQDFPDRMCWNPGKRRPQMPERWPRRQNLIQPLTPSPQDDGWYPEELCVLPPIEIFRPERLYDAASPRYNKDPDLSPSRRQPECCLI